MSARLVDIQSPHLNHSTGMTFLHFLQFLTLFFVFTPLQILRRQPPFQQRKQKLVLLRHAAIDHQLCEKTKPLGFWKRALICVGSGNKLLVGVGTSSSAIFVQYSRNSAPLSVVRYLIGLF